MAWGVGAPQEGTPRLRSIIFRARGGGKGVEPGATPRSPAHVGWGCAKSSLLTAARLTKTGGVADAEQGAEPPMRKSSSGARAERGGGDDAGERSPLQEKRPTWWGGHRVRRVSIRCTMYVISRRMMASSNLNRVLLRYFRW